MKTLLQKIRSLLSTLTSINPNLDEELALIVQAVGGLNNIISTMACTTRLRLCIKDMSLVDSSKLKIQGAIGVVILDQNNLQIIYGLKANAYSQQLEQQLVAESS
ncbi:glucose PTS transporter subunit EIIB [Agarivorans sp. QJM3NY_33]|uniref:glucose PTS transporter subunit EIIB n=1 Tax=Agarivorans sp. QJM3NY_33 TaxID=3421432 RepID=UPI003D7F0BC3